jgi:hypothetical protein
MSEMWHVLSCFDKALGCYSRVNNSEDGSAITTREAWAPSDGYTAPCLWLLGYSSQALRIGPPKLWQSLNVRLAWPGVAVLRLAQ